MDLSKLNKDRKAKKGRTIDLSTMVYGKVPPQARDLEAAILGAIMIEKTAFDRASEILKPESFYVEAHQRIFKTMLNLNITGRPIDILTVVEELKKAEELEMVGGPYYVTQLTNAIVSSANIEDHSRIIQQKFLAREMIRLSMETISEGYEDSTDVFEMMEKHEKKFTDLVLGRVKKGFTAMDVACVTGLQRLELLRQRTDHMTGVPSGIKELDHITNGWQDTDLIILAARPSVGKTALAIQFSRSAAMDVFKPVPVGLFSLEMSTQQITERNWSAESEIWLENIRNGRLDDEQMKVLYQKGIMKLAKAPIFIDDTAAISIYELHAAVRRLKRLWMKLYSSDRGLIILDYLQLMSGNEEKGNREQEISKISRGLKRIAKEEQLPVIALSQLSRAVESRKDGNKMPMLSDLRDSGAIEQDADMVLFMYRPEYYDITANEMGDSNKGETHIRIAKHRNGSLGLIKLRAMLHIQKFMPWDGEAPTATSLPSPNTWRPVKNFTDTDKDLF
jgi:replicative DNA helicase